MSIVERFFAYAAAFEETYADDDWSRLRQFFTDDADYTVVSEDGTETRHEGVDGVLDGLREAVNNLDRRFATRKVELRDDLEEKDDEVVFGWDAEYSLPDAPLFRIGGTEYAVYEGDRIRHLKDVFDAGTAATIESWMGEHGAKLAAPRS